MRPEDLFSLLSDRTRLRALMLIQAEGELCVCELTFALGESQPKVSRHLALMRQHSNPLTLSAILIAKVHEQIVGLGRFGQDLRTLGTMNDRPGARACA